MEMMKALVVKGIKELVYTDIPVPKLEDDAVLIKVRACGICGSDMPRAKNGEVHSYPIVIGHEFSGDIVKVGSQVKGFKEGERVTAAPLIPCHSCENCAKGRPAMCGHYSFIGSRQAGAMAQYVSVPVRNVVRIADNVTYEQAACIEPLTVAIHGIERVRHLQSGKSAIVYGCGTIGILTMQCLKAKGIERVYVIDIDNVKLELAQKLGAYKAINSAEFDVPAYFEKYGQVDYVFETAGINTLQGQVLSLVKKTGSIVYIGTAHHDVIIPAKIFELILRGELNVTGSWMSYSAPFPGDEWKAATEFLQSAKVKVDEIITHRFPLSAGYQAFEAMLDKEQHSLKVMFIMD